MLTAEQYKEIQEHRGTLELFKKSGEWIGGNVPFYIYERLSGEKVNTGCPSCMSAALIGLLNMIYNYERGM